MNSKKMKEDLASDFNHIWHPATQMKDHETEPPLLIDKGEGVYLIDRQGNRYLDGISSWWVNIFGHNHPRLNAAVIRQLKEVAHVMFAGVTHQPAIDLAKKLVRNTPKNLNRVFFSDNGSTSIEIALKMSAQYWLEVGKPERKKFVYLKGAYHGETLGALSVCGIDLFRTKFQSILIDNIEASGPDCDRCPYGLAPETCSAECFEPMERILNENSNKVAGAIVEPLIQGATGMKMYPSVYLKRLTDTCKALDIHTIFDEVAVGFGRTGALFVCQEHGFEPTFLCLSKGLTSGYLPLAATLTEDKIFQAFYDEYDTFKLFLHSHSYTANPLACACANETLDMLTEKDFFVHLKEKSIWLREGGKRLEKLKHCGEYRQIGMVGRVELLENKEKKTSYPFEKRLGYKIYLEGLKRGVLLRPLGNVIYFMPPLIISKSEIEFMTNTAYDCIHNILK
jgi:adenosylmethionine---8-amino-7-oxononanoate aminotransferase